MGPMTDYLSRLNPEQREAVETVDGPLLVLAGAGTGKTRVLTTRFAHILLTGRAFPSQVLAVTFTNKAAREMRERVAAMLGRPAEGLWLGTFHALCARMLRRHAELVGLTSSFNILDTDDQLRLLKQVMEAGRIDTKRWAPPALMALIQRWKDRGLPPARLTAAEDTDFANGRARDLYAAYQDRLRSLNAADFGDLLLHVTEILRDQPDVLAQYHRTFRYILVDEYQDTNLVQYLWLRLLAQSHRNICCVGDDDQSIYSWRGAEVENILRFEKDFPGRANRPAGTQLPLDRADPGRRVRPDRPQRGPPGQDPAARPQRRRAARRSSVVGLWDSEEEARMVGDRVEQLRRDGECAGRNGGAGARRLPDPRLRGAADHARPALPRHRRPAVLRARRNPRRHRLYARPAPAGRRPGVRAHRQRAAPRRRRAGAARHARYRPRAAASRCPPPPHGWSTRAGFAASCARRSATCCAAFARWRDMLAA